MARTCLSQPENEAPRQQCDPADKAGKPAPLVQ
jgi:hypothetical protein